MHDQLAADADRRDCPKCGREIMAAATRCGYCWAKLTPIAAGSPGTRVGPLRIPVAAAQIDESLRRDCPKCGRRIMVLATTCGYCWTKFTPPPPDSARPRRTAQPPIVAPRTTA